MGALQAMVVCLFLVRACTTNAQVEQWKSATATYSKETDASIITEGACGYGDLHKTSYGKYSAGLSTMLFNRGSTCGGCFELRCVDHILWCLQGAHLLSSQPQTFVHQILGFQLIMVAGAISPKNILRCPKPPLLKLQGYMLI